MRFDPRIRSAGATPARADAALSPAQRVQKRRPVPGAPSRCRFARATANRSD